MEFSASAVTHWPTPECNQSHPGWNEVPYLGRRDLTLHSRPWFDQAGSAGNVVNDVETVYAKTEGGEHVTNPA